MQYLGEILNLLNIKMNTPIPYGGFHLFFLITSFLAGVLLCRYHANAGEGFIRRLLFVTALTVIGLEIYKQINFSFRYDGKTILFDYQWYAFPFQFCSTPMYIGLLAALIKNERIHRSLCAYLGTYSLFAGLCVMFYPVSVFVDTIGINIQTMVCHGSMVSIGLYLLCSGYVKTELRTVLRAFPVFLTLVLVASLMNEAAYQTGLLETETFNMFFISPYCAPELPVYASVQRILPFPLSLLVYILAFTTASCLVLSVTAVMKSRVSAVQRMAQPLHSVT